MRNVDVPGLRVELRQHRAELLRLLAERDYERRFAQPQAWLFPLLGQAVSTPLGLGRLVQVAAERCAVVIDSRAVFVLTEDLATSEQERNT